MTRINVFDAGEYDELTLAGWFDPARATRYDEAREWNGSNHIGAITRSQWVYESLYRTAGGRWVLCHDTTSIQGGTETYTYVSDDEARDWLIRSQDNDTAIEQHFGPVEPERGPGRPEIGPAFSLRMAPELLARVDAAAAEAGVSRAEQIRRLVTAGLPTRHTATYTAEGYIRIDDEGDLATYDADGGEWVGPVDRILSQYGYHRVTDWTKGFDSTATVAGIGDRQH